MTAQRGPRCLESDPLFKGRSSRSIWALGWAWWRVRVKNPAGPESGAKLVQPRCFEKRSSSEKMSDLVCPDLTYKLHILGGDFRKWRRLCREHFSTQRLTES